MIRHDTMCPYVLTLYTTFYNCYFCEYISVTHLAPSQISCFKSELMGNWLSTECFTLRACASVVKYGSGDSNPMHAETCGQ